MLSSGERSRPARLQKDRSVTTMTTPAGRRSQRSEAGSGDAAFLPPPTRAVAAADEIRRRILDGHYAAGQPLRQDALAEELGVSRIPVREALVQLEAEGLLKLHAHKGAIVTAFSPEDVEELFAFRSLLEPHLLERSAARLDAADFTALDAILADYSEDMRQMRVGRWGELNERFHALLYRHADSPRIEATARQLLQSTDRFTRMQLVYTDGRAQAEREHGRIVALCKAGDFARAREELRRHIVDAGHGLVALLRDRQRSST